MLKSLAIALVACLLVALGVVRRTGDTGIVRVADDQVAVVVDRLDGSSRVVERPGYLLFLPLVEKVHLLDKRPRVLRMEGSRPDGEDRVPQLLARARDGSTFGWKEVEIRYALLPEAAAAVVDDAGPGPRPGARLLEAAARAILRDELGRFGSEEVARGDAAQPAARAAALRLDAALRPHGLEVLGISLGKPAFDEAYEDAIRRRAGFAQEVEDLETRLVRLGKEREKQEADARREKEIELLKLEGTLARDLASARKEDVRLRREADEGARATVDAGRAAKLEKASGAAIVKARNVAAARAVLREAQDLERTGDLAVRAALVRKLAGIQFDLAPYRRDPAPERIEYETAPAAKARP